MAAAMAVVASFVATWAATAAAARAILPRAGALDGLPWSERTRLTYPAQVLATSMPIWCALFLPILYRAMATRSGVVGIIWLGLMVAASAYLGGTLAAARLHERTTVRPRGWFEQARGQLLFIVILAPHLPVILLMAYTVGPRWNAQSIAWASLGLVCLIATVPYSGLPLAWLLGASRPPGPKLIALVESVAVRVGVRPKGVHVVKLPMANAFALPFSGHIALTSQLIDEFEDDELAGIVAHELGHLGQGRSFLLTLLVSHFAWLTFGLGGPLIHSLGFWGWHGMLLASIAVLALAACARRRGEVRADSVARNAVADGDPAYARALEKLHRSSAIPAVMWGCSVHPHLYDRLEAAGVTPDFERPAPPRRRRLVFGALLAIPIFVTSFAIPQWVVVWTSVALLDRAGVAQVLLAANVEPARQYFELARIDMGAGRNARALRLVDEALRIRPRRHAYVAARAALLASLGECEDANDAYVEALALGEKVSHDGECRWIKYAADALAACESHLRDDYADRGS